MLLEILSQLIQIASAITSVSAAAVIIIKPLRDKVLGIKKIQDGQKCLLRAKMLEIYYKHLDKQELRQYEYENFLYMYAAYKALSGNSFIDKIKTEVDTWTVLP